MKAPPCKSCGGRTRLYDTTPSYSWWKCDSCSTPEDYRLTTTAPVKRVRWIPWAAIVLAALLFFVGVASARAEFEQREPTAVSITCAALPNNILGFTSHASWTIKLDETKVCAPLRNPAETYAFAVAVATLYHEWTHAFFHDTDEGDVECVSLFFLRYELRHVWGFTPQSADTLYQFAWIAHERRALEHPEYKGWCSYPQEDPVP